MNANSYMNLGPVFLYLIRGANTLTAGDVDGDGRVEIASYCPTNNTFNILSYFEYYDASPSWATPEGESANGQMINAWACIQTIPPNSSLVNGWALQPGDQYYAAKLTGGAASLVIFNPSTLNFGIVQWMGQQMELVWFIQGQSAKYCGTNSDTRFFTADINGDGKDELMHFNPDDQWLFVLQWGAAGLISESSSHGSVGPWTISSTDTYLSAHVVAGAADQIVALSPASNQCCVLSWANGQFSGVVAGLPGTYFGSFSAARAADVDGDGLDEIVLYSNGNAPVVMKWNGTAFAILATASAPIGDFYSLFPFQAGGTSAMLLEYDGPDSIVTVNAVQNSALTTLWTGIGAIPGSVGVNKSDEFCIADVDGDGNDEVVMLSETDNWLFTIKWDGSELTRFTSVQNAALGWSVALLVQAPSTPFGPLPFSGNQATIYQTFSQALYPTIKTTVADSKCTTCSESDLRSWYQYLGVSDFTNLQGALNAYVATLSPPDADTQAVINGLGNDFIYGYISDMIDPKCGSDIRHEYIIDTYKYTTTWATIATQVSEMTPLPGSSSAAWTILQSQLVAEMNGLASVVDWSGADVMGCLNSQMLLVQTTALGQAVTDVNGTDVPSSSDTCAFWWENVIDAVIWGMAAIPALATAVPAAPILLAMAASIFPAEVSGYGSAPQGPTPEIQYGQFAGLLAQQYSDSSALIATYATTISSDPILLPLLGGLFNGSLANEMWTFSKPQVQSLAAALALPATLQYYSIFIPMRFNFLVWQNLNSTTPYFCRLQGEYQGMKFYQKVNVGAPSYAYWVQPSGANWNIYMLCQGTDPNSGLNFPEPGLMTNLFTKYNVSASDFFQGKGLWSGIQSTVMPSMQECANL